MAELDALNRIVDALDEAGASLIALSPELPEHSRTLIEEKKLKFEILHDSGNDVANEFGLRWTFPDDLRELYKKFGIDLSVSNGEDSWTLAMPARYIIDSKGTVQYARVDPDYTRRPEPEETLEALKAL